jgi:small-conductance mechanosensitive channel
MPSWQTGIKKMSTNKDYPKHHWLEDLDTYLLILTAVITVLAIGPGFIAIGIALICLSKIGVGIGFAVIGLIMTMAMIYSWWKTERQIKRLKALGIPSRFWP